eukprot:COSAG01_NODE_2465_length_7642_cov_11.032878_14_plen_95_part_00
MTTLLYPSSRLPATSDRRHAGVEDALYQVLRCPGQGARIGGPRRVVRHMAVRRRDNDKEVVLQIELRLGLVLGQIRARRGGVRACTKVTPAVRC